MQNMVMEEGTSTDMSIEMNRALEAVPLCP